MTTALQLFRDALDETDAVGHDQQLTDDEEQTCLRELNRFIGSLSTQSLAVYGKANETFLTATSTATYTIGPSGTWNTTRPIRIEDPAYTTYQQISYPCLLMTQGEYNIIDLKTQPNPWAWRYLYVNDNPLGIVTLWPVPDQILPITFSIERVLTTVTNVSTDLVFPPGYEDMFESNLGVRLAPRFGAVASQELKEKAKTTLGDIKRANASQRKKVMRSGSEYSDSTNTNYSSPYSWISYP